MLTAAIVSDSADGVDTVCVLGCLLLVVSVVVVVGSCSGGVAMVANKLLLLVVRVVIFVGCPSTSAPTSVSLPASLASHQHRSSITSA